MIFSSENKQFRFLLNDSFVPGIVNHMNKSQGKETGGILIGNYNENRSTAVVKKITGPPIDSRSGFSWFERGLVGLQRLLNRRWPKNEYYLGEWHYHPFSSPSPSSQDICQMKAIATSKGYNCPEPILMIIGGEPNNYEIKVFITHKEKFFELNEDEID